jgi:hypothetical protein
MRRRVTVAAVIGVVAAVFVFSLYLPWLTQWGSTTAEQTAPMAGDSLVAGGRRWTQWPCFYALSRTLLRWRQWICSRRVTRTTLG